MKIDTNASLVDLQPIYQAVREFEDGPADNGPGQLMFLREKIAEAIKHMRETAAYAERAINKKKRSK